MAPFPPNLEDGERWIPSGILFPSLPVPEAFPPSLGGHDLSAGAHRFSTGVLPYGTHPRPPPPSHLVPQQRFGGTYRGQFQPPIHNRSWNGFRPASLVPPSRPVIPYRVVPPQVMTGGYHRPHRPPVILNSNTLSVGTGVFVPQVFPRPTNQRTPGGVEPQNINNIWRSERMESEGMRAAAHRKKEPPLEDLLPSEWTY